MCRLCGKIRTSLNKVAVITSGSGPQVVAQASRLLTAEAAIAELRRSVALIHPAAGPTDSAFH